VGPGAPLASAVNTYYAFGVNFLALRFVCLCYVLGMNPVLISQLVDNIYDYSKALIMQKPQSQLHARIVWLEKTLFTLQGRFMGDERFSEAVAEMYQAAAECLESQEAKNEGQVRLKAYN
jgi:hypothetical protein